MALRPMTMRRQDWVMVSKRRAVSSGEMREGAQALVSFVCRPRGISKRLFRNSEAEDVL